MALESVLAPSLLLLLLGVAMRHWMGFGDSFWEPLERSIYYILFPALLFLSVARSGPGLLTTPGFIETAVMFTGAGVVLGYASRYLFKLDAKTFASAFQCSFRFSSYIGFAIMGGVGGDEGVAVFALLTSVLIPPINAISIIALAHARSANWILEVFKNPLVLSTGGGVLYGALVGQIPVALEGTLKLLASAALPLGLIAVGAGVRWFAAHATKRLIAYVVAVKLIVVPAVAFLVARRYNMPENHFNALLVLAALPTATNSYILAVRMGGDGRLVASVITANIVGAIVTLPLWLKAAGL